MNAHLFYFILENYKYMIERKAIFISEDKLTNIFSENKTLVVFDLENNHVIGVETIVLKKKFNSTEEILYYLQRKYINLVYVSEMDIETEIKFSNFNIKVKTESMLNDDKLLNTIYFSPPHF